MIFAPYPNPVTLDSPSSTMIFVPGNSIQYQAHSSLVDLPARQVRPHLPSAGGVPG
jgi:hypothetical protein